MGLQVARAKEGLRAHDTFASLVEGRLTQFTTVGLRHFLAGGHGSHNRRDWAERFAVQFKGSPIGAGQVKKFGIDCHCLSQASYKAAGCARSMKNHPRIAEASFACLALGGSSLSSGKARPVSPFPQIIYDPEGIALT